VDPGAKGVWAGSTLANPFSPDSALGRMDFCSNQSWCVGLDVFKKNIDWMSTNFTGVRHYWITTLTHGNENNLPEAIAYVYSKYGPGGTGTTKDVIWVAPDEQVYSYLLVRDNSTVSLVSTHTLHRTMFVRPVSSMNCMAGADSRAINVSVSERGMLKVFAVDGSLVGQRQLQSGQTTWQFSSPGVYFVRFDNSQSVNEERIVIR
jgi:hypothetical protein